MSFCDLARIHEFAIEIFLPAQFACKSYKFQFDKVT